MTLILTMQCNGFAAMASDRLLTPVSGKSKPRKTVKHVLFYNDIVFGYTGLAELPSASGRFQDTAVWLGTALASAGCRSIEMSAKALQQSANEAFERVRRVHSHQMPFPQAFLGVGWERDDNTPPAIRGGITVLVTNYHEDDGGRTSEGIQMPPTLIPGTPRMKFDLHIQRSTSPNARFASIGWPMPLDISRQLNDEVQAMSETGTAEVRDYLGLLVKTIRRTAVRPGVRRIGKDVLGAILTPEAAICDRIIVGIPQAATNFIFANDLREFKDLPESSRKRSVFYHYSDSRDTHTYNYPTIIAPGFEHFRFDGRPTKGETIDAHFGVKVLPGGGKRIEMLIPKSISRQPPKKRRK